jgi:hypothetical protein
MSVVMPKHITIIPLLSGDDASHKIHTTSNGLDETTTLPISVSLRLERRLKDVPIRGVQG